MTDTSKTKQLHEELKLLITKIKANLTEATKEEVARLDMLCRRAESCLKIFEQDFAKLKKGEHLTKSEKERIKLAVSITKDLLTK